MGATVNDINYKLLETLTKKADLFESCLFRGYTGNAYSGDVVPYGSGLWEDNMSTEEPSEKEQKQLFWNLFYNVVDDINHTEGDLLVHVDYRAEYQTINTIKIVDSSTVYVSKQTSLGRVFYTYNSI